MITSVTSSATLAFLDLYLKDDPAARAYLGSEALVAFSGKKATLERKWSPAACGPGYCGTTRKARVIVIGGVRFSPSAGAL
jgi:hypothetical protein